MKLKFETRYKNLKILFFISCLLCILFYFFSYAFAGDAGVLIVKGDYNYPPYEYLNEKNMPDGFNVEIMRAVAKGMGMKIRIELDAWHKVRAEIEEGKIDALLGMYQTMERDKLVDFSTPHSMPSYSVFVRKTSKITSLEQAQDKTIIVEKDDLGHDYIVENNITENLVLKKDIEEVLKDLSTGVADCAVVPRLQGKILLKNKNIKNVMAVGPPIIQRKYCFAVTKGNEALLAKLNEGLSIIKTSGEYERIYQKWFGVYEQKVLNEQIIIRYLVLIVTPLLITILFVFFWNWSLKKQVKIRTRQLQESKDDLNLTLNSIGDGVISTDIYGNITRMNPVAESLTGWLFKEAESKPLNTVFNIIHFNTDEPVENPVDQVLTKGKIIGLANHTALISKQGIKYQIADSGSPIKDAGGGIRGVVFVFRDVTKDKKAEQELDESEKKYRKLIETTSEGFWLVDSEERLIDANKSFCNMFGYSRDEIQGKYSFEFVDEENSKILQEHISQIPATLHRTYEIFMKKKNGLNFPALVNATSLIDENGNSSGSFAFVKDMTKQKKAEEQMLKIQKLRSIGTLAGGIAHDFNNVLTGIYGNISMAREKIPVDSPAMKYLEQAENSMNRATELTNRLLTFAKGGEPLKEDVHIGSFVEEQVCFDLSGSNVKLVFDCPGDIWMADVDRVQILQVFTNLVTNARCVMPDGGHLYIKFKNTEILENTVQGLNQGQYIKVTVQDEGPGIKNEHLGQIFDPYFSTMNTGRGLGLATVYSILQRHGGLITVDSDLGKGTSFTLYLPASRPRGPGKAKEDQPVKNHNISMEKTAKTVKKPTEIIAKSNKVVEKTAEIMKKPVKVLVMDDEASICKIAAKMLEKIGFSVETAPGGREAIELYKNSMDGGEPFDAVIMDLTIPGGIGGKEAIREILAFDPKARAIVSSGYADDPVVANYGEYGFKGIATKPYTMKQLQEVLIKVLKL